MTTPDDLAELDALLGLDPSQINPASPTGASGPRVYMGRRITGYTQGRDSGIPKTTTGVNPLTGRPMGPSLQTIGDVGNEMQQGPYPTYEDETLSLQQAIDRFVTFTEAEVEALAQRLIAVGKLDEGYDYDQVEAAWTTLVTKAARQYTVAGKKLTPFDVIDKYYGADALAAIGSTATPATPKISTVVNRSVQITDNDGARRTLSTIMAQDLGRRPTEAEIDDFQVALNDAQRKAPQVSTIRSQVNADGTERSSDTTTTGGGINADAFAEKFARGDKPSLDSEYGQYQAASTYYDALLGAIRGPVGM